MERQLSLKPILLPDFLKNLNVAGGNPLPMLHTTASANIFSILESGKLGAMPCNVFRDKLCYFFVGRPAYKTKAEDSPEFWQLPLVFVVRFPTPPKIKRVYPFDSGAFKSKRLPTFLTAFPLEHFEMGSDLNQVGRLISFFFQTPQRYIRRSAVGSAELKDQFSLDARHQEILALARLYLEHSSGNCDDRAAAVEVQVEDDIQLNPNHLLGIILPEEYMRVPVVKAALTKLTPHIEAYDLLPLNMEAYYGVVYECVNRIYKKYGIGK